MLGFQGGEATVEGCGVGIHWRDLECRRVEEGKCKVDVCITVEIQVLGCDLLAIANIGPALVVSDGPLRNTVPPTAGSVDASTTTILSVTRRVHGVCLVGPNTELRSRATISKFGTADVQGALLRV